jgi:hypothetical protein
MRFSLEKLALLLSPDIGLKQTGLSRACSQIAPPPRTNSYEYLADVLQGNVANRTAA